MIKVLIAEDELPLLRGIKIMIEKLNSNFTVVKCVHNGKEAIEYLKNNEVNVIFTDINMPLIDGIGVMEYVSQNLPNVSVVVISGYNDFNYAQKSLHYGAKEYLLKPIEKRDLEVILNNIYNKYKSELLKEQRNILKDVIYTNKKLDKEEYVQIIYLCAGPFIKDNNMEESVFECNFWEDINVEEEVLKLVSNKTCIYAFEKYQYNEKILLVVSDDKIDVKSLCRKFIKQIEHKNINITAVFNEDLIPISEIPTVCGNLRRVLQKNIVLFKSSVNSSEHIEIDDKLKDLYYLLNNLTENKKLILRELENKLKKEDILQINFIKFMENILKHIFEEDDVVNIYEMINNFILYSKNEDELINNIKYVILEKNEDKCLETTEDLMKDINEYIIKNFAKPITLNFLASKFGFVPPYLSKLFKEYSGYTISQYIQKIRLENAKSILRNNPEILAKDVGEIVGYPNPFYFSKIFKKKVGVYPSEYRKNEN